MDTARRIALCALAASPLWTGCAQLTRPRPEAVARLCGPEIGGAPELLTPKAFVLLGELHGTNEIPYVVGELACQAAASGQPVTVGVELAVAEQPLLDQYLSGPGGEQGQQRLFNGKFWNRPYQDGRSSKAMAALLERLRALRQEGLPVRVLAFDVPSLTGDAHEEAIAQNLRADREQHPDHTYLVLAGNVHVRTTHGVDWDPKFVPMGMRLLQTEPGLRALDAEYAPGTAWTCQLSQPITCGVQLVSSPKRNAGGTMAPPRPDWQRPAATRATAQAGAFRGYRPFIRLSQRISPEGFHGIFYVGPITASPPAASASLGPD